MRGVLMVKKMKTDIYLFWSGLSILIFLNCHLSQPLNASAFDDGGDNHQPSKIQSFKRRGGPDGLKILPFKKQRTDLLGNNSEKVLNYIYQLCEDDERKQVAEREDLIESLECPGSKSYESGLSCSFRLGEELNLEN